MYSRSEQFKILRKLENLEPKLLKSTVEKLGIDLDALILQQKELMQARLNNEKFERYFLKPMGVGNIVFFTMFNDMRFLILTKKKMQEK